MSNNNKNAIAVTGVQKTQLALVQEMEATFNEVGCPITPYGKECATNAIAGAFQFLKSKDKDFKEIDGTLFKLSVQSVALLELNYASIPSEVYFDLRGNILTIKQQGAGNEKLVRKYGVGIAPNGLYPAWLVREGDEFELPSYNGLEASSPTWKPKYQSNKKVIYVVYPVRKTDGSIEWLIADRESVKANIIAQIRQNTLYKFKDTKTRNEFYDQLNVDAENMSVDELLATPKYSEHVNPTYTSGGSKEAMIIRKMKNNALKNYPKEYGNALQREAVENLYEDRDDSLNDKTIIEADVVEKVEEELKEEPKKNENMRNVDINEDGEVITPATPKEEPKEEPKVEKPVKTEEEDYGF